MRLLRGLCQMMFELLLKVMARACELPTLTTPSPVANLFCLAMPHSRFPPPIFESVQHILHESYRTLRDGSFGVALSQALRARLRSCCPSGTFDLAPPSGRVAFGGRVLRYLTLSD